MTVKSVFAPHLGRHVKLGRKRAVARAPRLSLRNYLDKVVLPPPPASCDFSLAAMTSLSKILLNDSLGNCVIAGGYHIEGVATGNANQGQCFIPTDAQIIADYSAIGGYVPGDPSTDQGCNEQDAIHYWTHTGFANGTKLLGGVAVDPNNVTEIQQAQFLFENLLFGVELPDAWINPFPAASGFTWDVGTPDPQNGHCFIGAGFGGAGYSRKGVLIGTWGLLGEITWEALAALCAPSTGGELYVLLTPDIVAKGQQKAPNGVLWNDLLADFAALSGNPVPVPPAPPAPPAPPPTPLTGLSLEQAQAAAAAGLAAAWPSVSQKS